MCGCFWTSGISYTFTGDWDGAYPIGVIQPDNHGRFYGTTGGGGGMGAGVIYVIYAGQSMQRDTAPSGECSASGS